MSNLGWSRPFGWSPKRSKQQQCIIKVDEDLLRNKRTVLYSLLNGQRWVSIFKIASPGRLDNRSDWPLLSSPPINYWSPLQIKAEQEWMAFFLLFFQWPSQLVPTLTIPLEPTTSQLHRYCVTLPSRLAQMGINHPVFYLGWVSNLCQYLSRTQFLEKQMPSVLTR